MIWKLILLLLIPLSSCQLLSPRNNDHIQIKKIAGTQTPATRFLAETMTPNHYDIEVTPYFANEGEKSFTFDGKLKFYFTVNEEKRNTIRLHAERFKNINVLSVTDLSENAETVEATKVNMTEEESLLTISFNVTFKKGGDYSIELEYQGEISDEFSGMYSSSFIEDGKDV